MALLTLLVLPILLLCTTAFPQDEKPALPRNTIFNDEKAEGEVFENLDAFKDIALFNDEVNPYRLPTTTRPNHYNIFWTVNIADLSYSGTVDIDLYATEANVTQITIHSSHHTITSLVFRVGTAGAVIATTYELEEEYHFLHVTPATALDYNANTPVIYRLTIQFTAPMRTDMYGIYQSWFRNLPTDTNLSWMAATQFQATAGRFAFPCYDEPSFKATFDITIRRPNTHRSWSCMRISQTNLNVVAGYDDDVYFPTPVMSTYLLAIIVADYESLNTVNNNGEVLYEVIARSGAIDDGQGDYAFEVGQHLLSNMSSHTGIDFYSVNQNLKMTQAAIPDFGAGAMENWGLLTYREAYLLYDENHTSGYFKQLIAYILSHEIAHMWFGNLVTCDWWDVLWLNEGFARYYQYFLTHWVEDYMGLETRFITEQIHTALLSDSANNPHPLTNPGVGSPRSVSSMFSTLTYNKGAAIIRMTEHLLGFDIHELGLQSYLSTYRFQTTLPIDLFNSLQTAAVQYGAISEYPSGFSVVDYYRSWTEQPGVPVLYVDVNHNTGDMTITQRRFNINTGYSSVNTNWIIPITFATASNPDFNNTKPTHIISNTLSIINKGSVGEEWVVFNKQQTGYYRVNYDDRTWNLIANALKGPQRTQIHQYNRAQIVNDVFQFARSGIMTYTRALTILSFLENETEYAPWVAAITGFTWLRNRFVGTENVSGLEALIARWATRVMDQITYYPISGENFMQEYLRYQLAPFMCAINSRPCRIAAYAQFRALVDSNIEVLPDNRLFVYCNGLREGTQADFNFLWNRFQNSNLYTEKITLLQSLGCTPHETALNTYLAAIFQDNYVIRPQDYSTALNSAASGNEGNTRILWNYISNNFEEVYNVSQFNSIAVPLYYVAARLRSEEDVAEFQGWAWQNQLRLGEYFQEVMDDAEDSRASFRYGLSILDDLNNYLVYGDEVLEFEPETTQAPTTPVTEPQPIIQEPESPEIPLPDSAATGAVSLALITLGAAMALRV